MRSSGGTRIRRSRRPAFAALLLSASIAAAQPAPSPAPPPAPRPGPLAATLHVEPAAFRLWTDRSAVVTVIAPAGVEELRLSASLGKLEAPVRAAPGRFTAAWSPPEEGFPQTGLFVAHFKLGDTWHAVTGALPLWGLGDAVVHATRRRSITVRIGEREFGPVTTDDAGVARVPVEVRPGERSAMHGKREIPLGVPEGQRAHVSSALAFAWASASNTVPILLVAAAPDGSPHPEGAWLVETDRGTVSAPAPISPGAWAAVWTLPAGEPGAARLTARLGGQKATSVKLVLPVRAGPIARLILEGMPAEVRPDNPVLVVRARAVDAAARPVPAEITFNAPLCPGGTAQELGAAGWQWRCDLSPSFNGVRTLELVAVARAEGSPEGREVASIPLRPGPAAQLVVAAASRQVRADGAATTSVRFNARDSWGNATTPAEPPAASLAPAEAGEVRIEADPEREGYVAIVRPRQRVGDLDASVDLSWGAARATSPLLLKGHRSLLSASARVGVLSNFKDVTAPEAALELTTLRFIRAGHFVLGAEAGTFGFSVAPNPDGVTGSTRYVPLMAEAGYRFPLGPTALSALVHGGAAYVINEVQLPDAPAARSSGWTPMGAVGLKLELPLWRGGLELSARGLIAADPKLPTLTGALHGASAAVGYRVEIL